MRGILQGLGLTLSHVTRPKVTRLYPYEKRKLPPRSRGLIQLIQEDGQATPFNLKCEACLLCEKACPPRAITIESRPTLRFRRRPYFSPTSVAGYYTPRISEYAVELCQPAVFAARADARHRRTGAAGGPRASRRDSRPRAVRRLGSDGAARRADGA